MQGFITLTVRSAKLTETTLEAGWSKVKSAGFASDNRNVENLATNAQSECE